MSKKSNSQLFDDQKLRSLFLLESRSYEKRQEDIKNGVAIQSQRQEEETYLRSKGLDAQTLQLNYGNNNNNEGDAKKREGFNTSLRTKNNEDSRYKNYTNCAELYELEGNEEEQNKSFQTPPVNVRNVVFTANTSRPMDLKSIADWHRQRCIYNPSVFAALQIKIREPAATFLVFGSGKIVVTGLRSIEQAKYMYLTMDKVFNDIMKLDVTLKDFNIQNIVARAECRYEDGTPFALDIARMHNETSCYVRYTSDFFPGAIYPVLNPKVMGLLFRSGKVVITGAKTIESLRKGWEVLYKVCVKYAVKPTAVNTSSTYNLSSRRRGDLVRSAMGAFDGKYMQDREEEEGEGENEGEDETNRLEGGYNSFEEEDSTMEKGRKRNRSASKTSNKRKSKSKSKKGYKRGVEGGEEVEEKEEEEEDNEPRQGVFDEESLLDQLATLNIDEQTNIPGLDNQTWEVNGKKFSLRSIFRNMSLA